MSKGASGYSTLFVLILIAILIYSITFPLQSIQYSFNSLFYIDNLLVVYKINPIYIWGLLGLLFGSVVGVSIAIKKLNLSNRLVLFPITILLLVIGCMSFLNKPLGYSLANQHILEKSRLEADAQSAPIEPPNEGVTTNNGGRLSADKTTMADAAGSGSNENEVIPGEMNSAVSDSNSAFAGEVSHNNVSSNGSAVISDQSVKDNSGIGERSNSQTQDLGQSSPPGSISNDQNESNYGKFKTSNNGDKYAGSYNKNQQREGNGLLIESNGNRYEGIFKNGSFYSGKVVETDSYGNNYIGEFKGYQREGKGILVKANGSKFEGAFQAGSFLEGMVTDDDSYGDKYTGEYKNYQRHGNGKLIKSNGSKYEGIFQSGSFFSGSVDEKDSNGSKYIGAYNNYQRDGKGTLVKANGSKYEGIFQSGSFFSGSVDEKDYDGSKYTGAYNNFQRDGKGILVKTNGSKYDGLFQGGSFWKGYADEIDSYGRQYKVYYNNGSRSN